MLFERGDCATLRAWGTILAFESQPSRGLISMNQLNFEGRLAAAPEMSNHGGTKVTRIRVIHNEPTGTDQETGERREDRVVALTFTAFGNMAETIHQHFFKGDQIILTARVENNDYIPKGGTEEDKVYGNSFIIRSWNFGAPGEEKRKWLAENRNRGQNQNQGYQDDQYR